jgi:hypothetical protein
VTLSYFSRASSASVQPNAFLARSSR